MWLPVLHGPAAAQTDVFSQMSDHIQRQIRLDKQSFLGAQICTEWFYRQHFKKPPKPKVEGISLHLSQGSDHLPQNAEDCQSRYPGGLEAAREDFSRTQSLLSLSLTFYEFTLVGDRNDDHRYSAAELQDMLESIGLPANGAQSLDAKLLALQTAFDQVHRSGSLDSLMSGMSILFEKGYRLTSKDRAVLNKVIG